MAFTRMIRDSYPAYSVRIAGSLDEARSAIGKEQVDIVVCDFYLGNGTAFDILSILRDSGIPVIVVSGAEDEEAAPGTIQSGAFEYIVKDPNYNYLKVLPLSIERALRISPGMPADRPGIPAPATRSGSIGSDLLSDRDEIQFRRLIIDPSELIARYHPDGTILFVNDGYCKYFGKTRGELIGRLAEQFLAEEDRAALVEHRVILNASDPAYTREYRVLHPDGSPRWVRRTDRALFDDKGRIIEFQMVARDITERKLAEMALRESEERYRMLAEHAFDGILIQDLDGTILYVNQSIVKMFGFSRPDEVLGKNTLSFIARRSQKRLSSRISGTFSKERRAISRGTGPSNLTERK